MFANHASPRSASHRLGSLALRPGTTSRRRPASTSTIEVDHDWRRHLPTRTNRVSSNPSAMGSPIRFGVLDQRGAVGDDGVVDRVPITTELEGDLVHGATVTADL